MPREVYVVPELERQTLRVYVQIGEDEEGRYFLTRRDDQPYVEIVPRMAEPPMYARIEQDIAEALGEALAPRPEATERHLDDALRMRDRLFELVERRF